MKILFIYKFNHFEPLGLMYLSSLLKSKGFEVQFIDIKFETDPLEKIESINPDIIGYSITSGEHKFYQGFNLALKNKFSFFSVFGGPHCTFFPDFIKEEGVDAICIGEGEYPMLELAEKHKNKEDITNIKNLSVKVNGEIFINKLRELIPDIDVLPFPDRELINIYPAYKKKNQRFVISGRGCPYQCTYCFNHKYNELFHGLGNIIRKRSVENVLEEISLLREKYNAKLIKFWDDIFIINREWTIEFCEKYKNQFELPYRIFVRANLVDEEIVSKLKQSGCITAQIGIEHGNEAQRNNLLMRNMTDDEIIRACNSLNQYKIKIISLNMFGLPDQNIEMAYEALKLNVKCTPAFAYSSVFQPYWGTTLAEYSIKKGYFNGDVDSYFDNYIKSGSILKMRDIDMLVRFHYIFSTAVSLRLSDKSVKLLINIPGQWILKIIYFIHKTYNYIFKISEIDMVEIFYYEISLFKMKISKYFKIK